jgi:hypothetical protein
MRYTVTYTSDALNALARLWMAAPDRNAVTQAGDHLDRILREDASLKGYNAGRGYRQMIVAPLIAEFDIDEDDRRVTIWSIRHVGELTNGH